MKADSSAENSTNLKTYVVLLLVAVSFLTWFAGSKYLSARDSLVQRISTFEQCKLKVAQIKAWEEANGEDGPDAGSGGALNQAVEELSLKAGIAQEQIASISPQQPIRENDTDYLKFATVVKLDSVELRQFAKLLSYLRAESSYAGKLHVSSIRLDLPFRGTTISTTRSKGKETWNVEVTLTYLVYAPSVAKK